MPNVIHDIIKLTGGIGRLSKLELQPPEQPLLVIAVKRRDAIGPTIIDVTIGDYMEFRFRRIATPDSHKILTWPYEGHWPANIDTIIRKRGYLDSALHYFLQPT